MHKDYGPCICDLDEVKDSLTGVNPYVLTGYRKNHNTFGKVIRSLFHWHNETMNIWIHLFGVCLYFVFVILIINRNSPPAAFGFSIDYDFEKSDSFKQYLVSMKANLPQMANLG